MNIVIVGQGAIGLLFYHFIQQSINKDNGDDLVTLRPSYAVNDNQGEYQFQDINGVDSNHLLTYADDNAIKCADIILFSVKSYQVEKAIRAIEHLLPTKAVIVLCHNGMGTIEKLPKSLITSQALMTMLTTHGCLRESPLNIIHTGLGQIDFGTVISKNSLNNITHDVIKALKLRLSPANFHPDISKKQWQKLAINCVINPLTALNNIDNGKISNKEYKEVGQEILQEVVLVAKAQGISLVLNSLIETVESVAKATSKNSSSMRCDIANNKVTEIDYINGYIHKLGQIHNISTPMNTELWQQVLELQGNK